MIPETREAMAAELRRLWMMQPNSSAWLAVADLVREWLCEARTAPIVGLHSPALVEVCRALAKQGSNIDAIKTARSMSGCGLKDAKEWFERVVLPTAFPAPPANTVLVRVAVAVDAGGAWSACGGSSMSERSALDLVRDFSDTAARVSIITANVPLPEPAAEIPATVESAT